MAGTPENGSELLDWALERGGTVRVNGQAAELDEWAAEHGRTLLALDTVDCASGPELIDALCDAFTFPEDTVSDWDSLDEGLGDFDVAPAAGLVVVWSNWDSIAMDDEPAMAVAVDALRTAAQSWCDEGVPWTVLVVGDGPAWDLPWAGEPPAPWEVPGDAEDELEGGDVEFEDEEHADEDLADSDADLASRW